ncbi:D-alanyl-D-alanine carboxypeptidase family protein [Bacillus piscicola]|uniref:D-alanyl-D-alanine carboxypeptidase family protein n=1 Tax=Bacillus piscicola TaxID=1632684 RepID=UPI003B82EDFD
MELTVSKLKKILFLMLCSFLTAFTCGIGVASAEEKQDTGLAEEATAALIMEAETGQVLYNKNENEKLPPASMTKIMTMLLVMEALEEDVINLEDKVTTSERAASMGGSQIFLEEGEQMTVEEMLKGIAIASANDASVAMAEHLEGTEKNFIKKMNEKAKELGLKHTHFQNTTGLPAEDHYTTAYDLAVMARALLQYEKILAYTSVYEDYLRKGTDKEFWLVNTNRLVKHYDGVDGLKTGYTKEAKYNVTTTAKKNGMRVITVLMGAETPKERNRQTTEMLNYAFQNFDYHVLAKKGTEMKKIAIEKGKQKSVSASLARDAALVLPKGKKAENLTEKIDVPEKIKAPAEKDTKVGVIQFYDGDEKIAEQELVINEEVESASWFVLFKHTFAALTGNG